MQKVSVYDQMTTSERYVASFLKNNGIQWSYEHPVFVWDENKRPRVWAPDFFLVPFRVYLEVCGSEKFDYNYRRRIFDNNGYDVIFLHLYKDKDKWIYHLLSYLEKFIKSRYHELNEILKYVDRQ